MEIRLKLCDFANVFPGFTRVNVSFLSNPKIDFEIAAGMVTISEIPGFHTWITRFLKTEVFSRVIFPKFGTTLLMNEDVEELRAIGGLYINGQYVRHSEGMLRVIVGTLTIHETDQANSRAEKNFYCLFSTTGNKAIYKTHLKSSGGNSFMWNQSILMNSVKVDENGVESVFLKMSLFNALKDRDVFFGMAAINVSQMVRYEGILGTGNGFKSFGLTNDNREIGKIDLSLKYLKPTAKIEKKPMERKIKNEAKAGARALTGSFKLRVSIGKCDDVKSKKNLKCFLNIENNVFEVLFFFKV